MAKLWSVLSSSLQNSVSKHMTSVHLPDNLTHCVCVFASQVEHSLLQGGLESATQLLSNSSGPAFLSWNMSSF